MCVCVCVCVVHVCIYHGSTHNCMQILLILGDHAIARHVHAWTSLCVYKDRLTAWFFCPNNYLYSAAIMPYFQLNIHYVMGAKQIDSRFHDGY